MNKVFRSTLCLVLAWSALSFAPERLTGSAPAQAASVSCKTASAETPGDWFTFYVSVSWCYDGVNIVQLGNPQCGRKNTNAWFVSGSCSTTVSSVPWKIIGGQSRTGKKIKAQGDYTRLGAQSSPLIFLTVYPDGTYRTTA